MDQVALNFNPTTLHILNAILGFIMFGVALEMKVSDFKSVLRTPRAFLIGLFCQFLLFPALTFLLISVLPIQASMALGMILVAACPGGNISNFITHLAKGNTALSVTMSAVSTMAAVVMTPFNTSFWGSKNEGTAAILQSFTLNPWDMFWTILILLALPMLVGLAIAHYYPSIAAKAKKPMKIFSLGFFGIFVIAALAANFNHFITYIGAIALTVAVHNAISIVTGYSVASLVKLQERDRRAVAIETGIQNSGLGLILIFNFFGGLGGMAMIAAWWGIWHLIAGFGLAYFWREKRLI